MSRVFREQRKRQMGLDNFFERTLESPERVIFPAQVQLCGGIFSGNGSDGSFRGKVYDEFFTQELSHTLYDTLEPDAVADAANQLEYLVETHQGEAWGIQPKAEDDAEADEYAWRPDAGSAELGYHGVTNQELRDLACLFRAAADQKLKLVAWF